MFAPSAGSSMSMKKVWISMR